MAGEKEEINEHRRAHRRRASAQSITDEERATLLAKCRAKDVARRSTPCAESIAMPCPNAIAFPSVKLAPTTHSSIAREGTASPPASPSTSTPEYTIRTDYNKPILTPFIYLLYLCHGILKHCT
jgi:hypothetical protein